MAERILVATDGQPQSAGALRMARLLAERDGSEVEVLTAYEPPALYPAAFNAPTPDFRLNEHLAREQLRGVRLQVQDLANGADWPVHAAMGPAAPAIARRAGRGDVSLVVMGIGAHRPVDRWLGSETALRVMQLVNVPVLAVQPNAASLPRRALVAVDFSELSLRAARACRALLGEGAELHLAHASWICDGEGDPCPEWMRDQEAGARARLDELARQLAEEGGVKVHTSLVRIWLGQGPARGLLDAAQSVGAELIAAGSHGLGFFGRVFMGSVSTRLVRGATSSVLVAPPQEVAPEVESVPVAVAGQAQW